MAMGMEQESETEMDEVRRLADGLLDGQISVADKERLEALVIASKAARRAYVEHLHLHGVLQESTFVSANSLAEVMRLEPVPDEGSVGSLVKRRRVPSWLPIAAALALMPMAWFFGRWQAEPVKVATFAKLTEVRGARWEGNRLPTEPGANIAAGRLKLAAGLATIKFQNGARVTMEGPAELEIVDQQTCHLHRGTLTAHVPPEAVGFVVNTEHAKLIDHGTDFGISVGGDGQAQVRVFDGKVELQHHESGERMELLTKQSAKVEDGQLQRSEREEDDTGTDRDRRRHSLPYGTGVMMLNTAEGKGRAGYAWSPGTNLHFSKELLILKYSQQPGFRRKAWLGFDLTKLQGRRVREATLTMMFEPTGWGYASLLPDAVFSVYAVRDDALDNWDADTLTWDGAPANDVKGPGADPGKAVKVGTFTMPEGVLEGAFSISGSSLVQCLNDDANRFVTLMVVRETGEMKGNGAVHGFAGNEHPLLRPPTLYLGFEE